MGKKLKLEDDFQIEYQAAQIHNFPLDVDLHLEVQCYRFKNYTRCYILYLILSEEGQGAHVPEVLSKLEHVFHLFLRVRREVDYYNSSQVDPTKFPKRQFNVRAISNILCGLSTNKELRRTLQAIFKILYQQSYTGEIAPIFMLFVFILAFRK